MKLLLLVLAGCLAQAEAWDSFFKQMNLAPGAKSVFSAEKNVGLYVEIKGELPEGKLPEFLQGVSTTLPSSVKPLVDSYLAQAEHVSSPNFGEIVHERRQGGAVMWKFGEGGELVQMTNAPFSVHQVSSSCPKQQLLGEAKLVQTLVEGLTRSVSSSSSGPVFLIWRLPGNVDLQVVNNALQSVKLGEHGVVAVSFTAQAAKAETQRRRLAEASKGFSGPEYVLMCWVLITLVIIAFFVFCCIPWAPELDPGLRSSLKGKTE
ncbi:hypothetical protein BASA81_002053 [Batrachochytrium salamandrivorans]|nr:hypothetical protein BASA81_002053 [Batrachochytrium salamandrivorans]